MSRPVVVLPLLLAFVSPVAAQHAFGARTHLLTSTPPESFLADGNLATWAASVANQPNVLIGGSVRTGHVSTLTASGPVGIYQIGRNPLVASEAGTENYWGLSMEGEWIPITLASTPTITLGQDLVCLDEGTSVHVFQWWKNSWVSEPLLSAAHTVVPGRNFLAVVDGDTSLIGFSKLVDTQPTRLDLGAGANWPVIHIVGSGESLTRRNFAMFDIGPAEIAVYSGYLDAWQRFTFPAPLTNYTFEYDKNTVAISDPIRNELFMYSAHTGTMQTIGVQSVASTTLEAQDFVVKIVDPLGNNLFCFRAIDGGLAVLPGQAVATTNQLFGNNHYTVQVTDTSTNSVDYYAISGSKRGSLFVAANVIPGETVVADDYNDTVALVVTDAALYGYSAFSNSWTRLPGWQGTYSRLNAQDFIGWVETDTHAYVFSPREDRWITRAKTAGETLADSDQLVVLGTTSAQSVYGMESTAFQNQNFAGTRFLAGRGNSYSYAIHDDPVTGASRIWFFQSYGNRWIQLATSTRISDPNSVRALEDGLLVMEPDRMHVLSSFADLSNRYSAPNDNYAYHAFPGSRTDFLASGVPGAAAFLLVGLNRAQVTIPGVTGELLIDAQGLVGVGVGNYDARGILRLPLTLPAINPRVLPMQMASLAPATGVQLGLLLQFEVF